MPKRSSSLAVRVTKSNRMPASMGKGKMMNGSKQMMRGSKMKGPHTKGC